MEREFKPPAGSPEAAAPSAPAPERPRPRKKEKSARAEKLAETSKSEAQNSAEKPPKRRLGARVLHIIFGEPKAKSPEATAPAETPQETKAQKGEATIPEFAKPLERASRLRRLARKVIAHVLGEAEAEPTRAAGSRAKPLDTEPLIEAAEDLREASDGLGDTVREVKETLIYERDASGYSASSPDFGGQRDVTGQTPSERIAMRVEQIEAKAGAASAASLVAVGLGVVAVLVAGREYFARKGVEKIQKKTLEAQQELATQVKKQQQEFVALQKEQAAQMDRQHRQDYYGRLSEFTHQQAASTREADRELKQSLEAAALPVPEPLPPVAAEALAMQKAASTERPATLEPLQRVETADTVERGHQSGNAGTGFFGGGMADFGGRVQQTLGNVAKAVRPPVRDISADTQQKARLASNAWLYSVGFVVAVIALVLSLVFSA